MVDFARKGGRSRYGRSGANMEPVGATYGGAPAYGASAYGASYGGFRS